MKKKMIKAMLGFGAAVCISLCGCGDKDTDPSGRDHREFSREKEEDNKDEEESDAEKEETSAEKDEDQGDADAETPERENGSGKPAGGKEGAEEGAPEGVESGGNSDIDLSGLSSKHGRAYVYVWSGTEYLYDSGWEFSECDGMIHDGDMEMQRTLTIYRFSDSSSVEYMLEFEGEWGEYWHVSDDYPADCTYFDYVEGGTVTVSGNTAVWEAEYGDYREIYALSETHEFDN